ncbi:MAG TPA: hypothetical protein VIT92_03025 [Burkholderiaceae bacterium]
MEKNTKIYHKELGLALLIYVAAIALCVNLRGSFTGDARYVLVLIPLAPVALMLRAIVRALTRMDELERRVQMIALAVAGGGTAMFSVTYGMMEAFAQMPMLSMWWIWVVFNVLWMGACFVAKRRLM